MRSATTKVNPERHKMNAISTARSSLVAITVLFTLVLAPSALAQVGDLHAHHTGDPLGLELELDDDQRWATDESLRLGMTGIRDAFGSKLPGFRASVLTHEDHAELADILDAQLSFMFDNCDLPPAADAQLHRLLASIAGVSAALRDEGRGGEGMRSLHRALDAYGRYFDHPGWSALLESDAG